MKVEAISSVLILIIAVLVFTSFGAYNFDYSGRATDPISNSCSDSDVGSSDGGIYKFGKLTGVLNGQSFVYYDSCIDASNIKEYSCSNSQPVDTAQSCTVGCSNGACVKPFVDLVVSSLTVDRVETNTTNSTANVFYTFTVKNRGNIPITSVAGFLNTVYLKQIVPSKNEATVANWFPALGANQEKSYSGVTYCQKGQDSSFSLTATADSYTAVAESIETNNQKVIESAC